MKINRIYYPAYYTLGLAAFIIASCSTTKSVPKNDALYTGAKVTVSKTDVGVKQKKAIQTSLSGLTRPKPNSKVLGMPIKLWIYNLGSQKGLGKILRNRFGEAPVLLSQVNLNRNVEILDNYLENRGFFHVKVTGDTSVKAGKASARYIVETGPEYKVKSVLFPTDSGVLETAIRNTESKTLLKAGAPFNLDLIKGERTRIDVELKEKGFYFFGADYLVIQVDSTIGNYMVNLYLQVKKETPGQAREVFRIKDVFIYSNYNLTSTKGDTSKANAVYHKGYYVIDSSKMFKPKVFEQTMQFDPGDIYSRKAHNTTLSRLINLGVYKFVKNRFETAADSGEAKLNAYYYLTPLPKKSLRGELTGTSKTNNLTGSQVTFGWRNRNAFRGAEQLAINVFGGSELQISGNFGRTNTFRVGGDATLSVPRFVIPFLRIDRPGEYVPRTNLLVGYELLNRTKLYTLTSVRGNYGYTWKESLKREHTFNPIAINYVKPVNVTRQYLDSMLLNPTLAKIIEQQFIIGSNYNFNFNQLVGTNNRTGVYFNGMLDLSGNILGLASGANYKTNDTVTLFGARFAQYLKTEFDTRYYRQIGQKSQWANRLILGIGYPYGNSSQLPFVKQFFAGGNNSLRGFRSRTVGPGSYKPKGIENPKTFFLPDQSGDIKIEVNSEFRQKLFSIVEGALFIDAGNVWLVNDDPNKPGARFSKDFLKQFAVDAGAGIRLDLTILLLRLDFALPLKVPYADKPPNNGAVINLAIGYPF